MTNATSVKLLCCIQPLSPWSSDLTEFGRSSYHRRVRSLLISMSAACCALMAMSCAPAAVRTTATVPAANAARQAAFVSRAHQLSQAWDWDVAQGVPASSVMPLRQQLKASPYRSAPASSAVWNDNGGSRLLASLSDQTTVVWTGALNASRQRASAVIDRWTAVLAQYGSYLPRETVTAAADWPELLASTYVPGDIDRLSSSWSATVHTAQQTASVSQARAATLQPYSSLSQLISVAGGAVGTARADGLDDSQVPALLAALQTAAAGGLSRRQRSAPCRAPCAPCVT